MPALKRSASSVLKAVILRATVGLESNVEWKDALAPDITLCFTSNVKLPTNKSSEGNAVSETCSAVRSSLSSVESVFLNVVPVNVICGEIKMAIYAFLDQGSTTTLCERSMANLMQVHGTPIPLNVDTLTSSKTLDTISFAIDVEPLDRSGDPIHCLSLYS